MGRLTRVLLVVALVVPVAAYVAGSLASSGDTEPADRGPVILRDATPTGTPSPPGRDQQDAPSQHEPPDEEDQQGPARVVTPVPTPVGKDDDDEWDDDGPDDDDTDDERDGERGDD